jgi:hypothetical protein
VYVAASSPECRSKSADKDRKQIVLGCVTVQIFGMTLSNQNLIQEEIKRRLIDNACCNSVQNLLSSCLL